MCASVSLVGFIAELWLFRELINSYFPTADDIAFAVTSTDIGGSVNALSRLTDGFQYYFQNYIEWQVAKTDFWRPFHEWLCLAAVRAIRPVLGDQLIVGHAEHALMVGLAGSSPIRC
jgi:hypothetical protein